MSVHLLRAFTMWLATVPMLIVPLLLGGIGLVDIGFALALEMGVVLGGLAGGMLASSLSDDAGRAAALAVLWTVIIGESLALLAFAVLCPFLLTHGSVHGQRWLLTALLGPWLVGTGLVVVNGFSGLLNSSPTWMRAGLLTSLGTVTGGSVVVWLMAFWYVTNRVRRFGHGRVLTSAQELRRRFWFKPRLAGAFRRGLRTRLRRNPMWWLYSCEPYSGLRRWAWCAIAVLVWLGIFASGFEDPGMASWVFGLPLALVIALASVASMGFRREMEGGFLELLLATPLPPASILRARVYTLWRDFLPALVLSTVMALLWLEQTQIRSPGAAVALAVAWSSFLAAPLVGSRLAVRRVNPLVGWAWTLGVSGLVPAVFAVLLASILEDSKGGGLSFMHCFIGGFITLQLTEGALSAWSAAHDLATRRFQLKPLRRIAR